MKFKKYLPVEDYELLTDLSVEEVLAKLKNNTGPVSTSYFASSSTDKPYEGRIEAPVFEINRVISYRNSFLPIIKGRVYAREGQTYIVIKMRLNNFVLLFTAIWLGITGLTFLMFFILFLIAPSKFIHSNALLFLPASLGFFLFGYLLCMWGFKYESRQSKYFLEKLFKAKPGSY